MTKKILYLLPLLMFLCACTGKTGNIPENTQNSQSDHINPSDNNANDTDNPQTFEEIVIHVDYADDEHMPAYNSFDEYIDDTSEYAVKIFFSTNMPVEDFKFVELGYVDNHGDIQLSVEKELYVLPKFSPENLFVVDMAFEGILPTRGISYTTKDGIVKCFAVEMSGKDGSLILTEIHR